MLIFIKYMSIQNIKLNKNVKKNIKVYKQVI